jgi:ubiquinone/menaquinone biosynthesis C-methylase UbiE
MQEIERIKEVYLKRKVKDQSGVYSFFNKAHVFMIQRRDSEMLNMLRDRRISGLEDKRILDVGCGTGGELRNLLRYGAKPENLFGIDLLEDRINVAARLSPNIQFRCCNAESVPFKDNSFDIVTQFTAFTSILDKQMKKNVAGEMLRVLSPGGMILWYDYHRSNPKNRDTKGVKREEIQELFPNCYIYLKNITLAPPIVRALAPYSIILCHLLEKIPLLCTHYLGIFRRNC